jgi:hypothetical protein
MKTFKPSYGKRGDFEAGDLVSWSNLSHKFLGIIQKVELLDSGGRPVAWATVFSFKHGKKKKILCLDLEKLNIFPINHD